MAQALPYRRSPKLAAHLSSNAKLYIGSDTPSVKFFERLARSIPAVGALPVNSARSRRRASFTGNYLKGNCWERRMDFCLIGDAGNDAPSSAGIRKGDISVVLFRALLFLILVVLSGYTVIVIANNGWNFFPTAFGDMFAMTWQKQFNLDFMGYLILSAVWTAWRHNFSPIGFLLGIVAFFGGMIFLAVYLLVTSFRVKGDVKALMLGTKRANA